ncbi:HalOD1 output domain-containing protein [Haloarchaeobius sp. HRN-SO-5]|uniref:HalOD1 output domain-containing protein n=1 Tax=Haloarchaeobius sp. HRN-SO-5 TaxID=3446118 RepID=UPI003EBCFF8A
MDESDVGREGIASRSNWHEFDFPSTAVAEAVAEVTDQDAMALTPLHEYVDADGLDSLLTNSTPGTFIEVSFDYEGLQVTVRSDGSLEVQA